MSKTIQIDTKTLTKFWLVLLVIFLALLFIETAFTGLLIVGAALFLALALWPLVKKVDTALNKKKSRLGLSAGLVVSGVVVIIVLALMVIGPVVVKETSKFLSTAPEQVQNTLSSWDGIDNFGRMFGINDTKAQIMTWIKETANSFMSSLPQTVFASIGTVANFLTGLILVIVLTILFLTQGPSLLESFWHKVGAKSDNGVGEYRRISGKLANVVSRYVTGQVTVAILDGIVVGLVVFILSIIFGFSSGLAFPMGVLAMIFYLIPMFGPIITTVLVSLILFFSAPFAGLSFLIFYIVYEQIVSNVISPRIQGNSLALKPLIILISIVIGMYMFGLVGAIISIPIAGCIKVLIDEYPTIRAINNGAEKESVSK